MFILVSIELHIVSDKYLSIIDSIPLDEGKNVPFIIHPFNGHIISAATAMKQSHMIM
jgi:hypothetical protein